MIKYLLIENCGESKIMNFKLFNEGKKDKFPNIKKVEIDDCSIAIYRDNTRPLKHENRPSLQTIIKQIPILCSLDTVNESILLLG